MKVTDSAKTPRQITLRWLFRLCLMFVLAAGALLAFFLIWRSNLSVRSKRALTRLKQAGYPVSFVEAQQKYYPEIPPIRMQQFSSVGPSLCFRARMRRQFPFSPIFNRRIAPLSFRRKTSMPSTTS